MPTENSTKNVRTNMKQNNNKTQKIKTKDSNICLNFHKIFLCVA